MTSGGIEARRPPYPVPAHGRGRPRRHSAPRGGVRVLAEMSRLLGPARAQRIPGSPELDR